jgi:hypothetical protein
LVAFAAAALVIPEVIRLVTLADVRGERKRESPSRPNSERST